MVAYKCRLLRMVFSKCMLQNPRANEPSHGPSRASQPSGPLLARLLNKARCPRAEPTPRPARLTPHLARLGSAQLGPVLMLGEPARLFANPGTMYMSSTIRYSDGTTSFSTLDILRFLILHPFPSKKRSTLCKLYYR